MQNERIKPSPYQKDIYRNLVVTRNNIVIKATAGSGKTTTLIEISKLIQYGKKSLFLAFNKHIVKSLKDRLATTAECSTMHSVGFKAITNYYGDVKLYDNLQINYIEPIFAKEKNPRKKWKSVWETDQLLRLARATMTPYKADDIKKLAEDYNLFPEDFIVQATMKAGRELRNYFMGENYNITIDFQAMIELCVLNPDIRMSQYDFVLLDEAQDCSKLDQLFVNRLIKPNGGRICLVGDPRQSIYLFRGSDINSFENFKNKENTITLPLSISYRCSKAVVREAKKLYPEIEEFSGNSEGGVRKGKLNEIQEGDFVLARNLRPLMFIFFQLINFGMKAHIVGKDLEKGLLAMLADYESVMQCSDVIEQFKDKLLKLEEKLKEKGITNPKKHPKYVQLDEKYAVLILILSKFDTIQEAETFIETVFHDDEVEGVKLMTIHKSKGLENDRVFLVDTYEDKKLIPSQYAVTNDQKIQEKNLLFVGITRAKKELIYLNL